jgi:DNA-binding transcriptional regulator YiaG
MTQELSEAVATSRRRRALPKPQGRVLIRQMAKLSQAELGAAVGELLDPPRTVSGATVSRWETGTREPRPPYADAYASFLAQLAEEVL